MKRLFIILATVAFTTQAWGQYGTYIYSFSAYYEGNTLYYKITGDNTVKTTYPYEDPGNSYKNCTKPTGDVIIPETVTDGEKTYYVTSIGGNTFTACSDVRSVSIPRTITTIGSLAFSGCGFLTSITIPEWVTSIEPYAFTGCSGLTTVNISNSVTSIGERAFQGCRGLTSVTIGNLVTNIDNSAFEGCSILTEINVVSANSAYTSENGVLFNKDKTTIVCYPIGKTETTYTIPESVTRIGYHAFYGCSGLTSITISNSVTTIGDDAFSYCSSLTSVTIPESVTSIGEYAFYKCSRLTSVTIGNSVTSIGKDTFGNCSSLTSVTIPESVTSIGEYAFYNCSGLTSVTIGNSVTSIGNYAFYGCEGLTSVAIPNSVTSIGSSVFSNCSKSTLYCECEESAKPSNWPANWNSNRPVKWGCKVVRAEANNGSVTIDGTNYAVKGDGCSLWYLATTTNGTATITATANSVHSFIKWNDEETVNPRTINVTESRSFTAIFETHTEAYKFENINPATCTTSGSQDSVVYCSVCNKELHRETLVIPAMGHSYGTPTYEWADNGSTCKATTICQRNENHIATEDATITSEETIAPTCEEMGTTTYTAAFENELFATQTKDVVDAPANGHSYSTTITTPTCTEVGYTTHTCSVCEYTYYSDTVAANGHTEVVDAAIAATCTTAGKTEGKHCSVCEAVLVAQEEVAALGHTEIVDAAVAATCTTTGKTEGKHCSTCNAVIVAQTEVAALGHKFEKYTYNNDATTTADGTKTAICERGCGATDTKVAEGTKLPEKATAVPDEAANAVSIYAYNNIIVVENAAEDIRVYDAMGKLICRDVACRVHAEINVNAPGVYIVKTGNVTKRVMVF